MDEGDPETWLAYYCFVNHGWEPSKYEKLPLRERVMISVFAQREIKSREKVR